MDESLALLVMGSSLTVYSAFRLVRRASEAGKPIFILNLGPTRGDPLAATIVNETCENVMQSLQMN